MALFVEVFDDVTKHARKIQTTNYAKHGMHPIIDQGQAEIAGYTDEVVGLFENVPAIIFGDHTRVIKYVDKPCFLGADGAKLLKAKAQDANHRYLYYVLQNAKIPNTGYNRHFKWLKEVEIQLPDAHTQASIVAILDKLNILISLRKQQLAKLDELVKARFIELFGELFYSDAKHYTVPEIAYVYIGLVTTMTKHYVDKGTPLVFNSTIKDNRFEFKERVYLDDEFATANAHRKHKLNDVVTVHTGDVGTSAIIGPDLDGSLGFATIVSRINDMNFVRPAYLCDFFNSNLCKDQLTLMIRGDRNNLNLKEFNQVLLTVPPIEQQLEWEQFRKQTDKSKLSIQQSLTQLETLKASLMQQYFG